MIYSTYKDDGTDIRVMSRDEEAKNVFWVQINGPRYALVYNHTAATIDLRQDTIQDHTLASFTNATPLASLLSVFTLV